MNPKKIITAYVSYIGTMLVMLLWVTLFSAYINGTWKVEILFNEFGEAKAELVVMTLVVTLIPLVWIGIHDNYND